MGWDPLLELSISYGLPVRGRPRWVHAARWGPLRRRQGASELTVPIRERPQQIKRKRTRRTSDSTCGSGDHRPSSPVSEVNPGQDPEVETYEFVRSRTCDTPWHPGALQRQTRESDNQVRVWVRVGWQGERVYRRLMMPVGFWPIAGRPARSFVAGSRGPVASRVLARPLARAWM